MKSYSQIGQDLWVLEMLENKHGGYFLDIGAFNGIELSNSYLLEKEFNWTGLCIEAHPVSFSLLVKNRTCKCANFALANFCGEVAFDSNCSLSSKISTSGHKVKAIDFKQLFVKFDVPQNIDYLSLDIEGSESIALSTFPFDSHKCSLMTIEHNLYLGDSFNKNEIKKTLLMNGYKIYRENVDNEGKIFEDWYVHGDK
jgi:FkbM family methyltransferase